MIDTNNSSEFCDLLFNVNEIFVRPCSVHDYIKFSHELDEYLCSKYSDYYAGLQLYQSKINECRFTIVAAYYDVPYICREVWKISEDIEEIYTDIWRNNVKRVSILSFCEEIRLL